MQIQNTEVASRVMGHLGGHLRGDASLRTLTVLFRIALFGPETVAQIAKAVAQPQSAVREDIAALRKPGAGSKVYYNLIQEIAPVTAGKPCCYRLSKRADKMMDDLDNLMQVYALPADDDPVPSWTPAVLKRGGGKPKGSGAPATFVFDDEDDEMLHQWEASRSVVRG